MQNTQRRLRMQALGAELARIRKAAGMPNQADLEERSGVSVRTISDIENGKKVPRINTMRKLEAALGLAPGLTDDYMQGKVNVLISESTDQHAREAESRHQYSRKDVELAVLLAGRGLSADEVFQVIDQPPKPSAPLPRVEPDEPPRTGTDR